MENDQYADHPLLVKDWAKNIPVRKVKALKKDVAVQLFKTNLPAGLKKNVTYSLNKRTGAAQMIAHTKEVGKHHFPPDIKSVALSRKEITGIEAVTHTHGFLPDHLPLAQFPKTLDKKLAVRQRSFINRSAFKGRDLSEPTNIFGNDDRYIFSDTSFPWCTCGKVENEAGSGSGVMIGPRHMMTASHMVVWKPGNTCGWIKFTPLKFDNSEPFGQAWVTKVYSWNKADGSDGLNLTEGAFDYVVCVLDSPMGNLTGWMGSRGYNSGWDGGNYWGHIGYPADLGGAARPIFIGYQSFIDQSSASVNGHDSYRIRHEIDVFPGQSGGPYFGWWSGESWPRVVGIQSGQNLGGAGGDNTCGGGNPLSDLINYARNAEP